MGVMNLSLKELEEQIKLLNPTVRNCIRHNNKAQIEADLYGDIILAVECGCYLECGTFSSLAEAVAWWNERPHLDVLVRDYSTEFGRSRLLRLQLEELIETMERISNTFVKLTETNSTSILDLQNARSMSLRALEQIKRYRASDLAKEK